MPTLYYVGSNTIPKDKLHSMIHKCKKCPYITKSWFFIQNHVRRHIYRRPSMSECSERNLENFVCEDCNFSTLLLVTFREHIKNHRVKSEDTEINLQKLNDTLDSVNEIYACEEIVSKGFTNENLEWFNCNECSHKTRSKKSLKQHIINQHRPAGIKWFQCGECSYKSKQKNHLKQHIINQHRPAEIKWFQCEECSHKSKQKSHLKRHIINQHRPADIKWFQCNQCSFKSKRESGLRLHIINRHETIEIKWFQCDECTFKSKAKSNLRCHIIHQHRPAEINWFQCDQCTFKSKQKSNLQKHISRHRPADL